MAAPQPLQHGDEASTTITQSVSVVHPSAKSLGFGGATIAATVQAEAWQRAVPPSLSGVGQGVDEHVVAYVSLAFVKAALRDARTANLSAGQPRPRGGSPRRGDQGFIRGDAKLEGTALKTKLPPYSIIVMELSTQ